MKHTGCVCVCARAFALCASVPAHVLLRMLRAAAVMATGRKSCHHRLNLWASAAPPVASLFFFGFFFGGGAFLTLSCLFVGE